MVTYSHLSGKVVLNPCERWDLFVLENSPLFSA